MVLTTLKGGGGVVVVARLLTRYTVIDDDLCIKLPKSQILSATTSEIHSPGHSYFTYDMAPRFKPFAMYF